MKPGQRGLLQRLGAVEWIGPAVGLVVLVTLFCVVLGLRGQLGGFFNRSNLQLLAHHNSIKAVAALGMLLIIVSGGIDLSVGAVAGLVTVCAMQAYRLAHVGPEYTLPAWLVDRLRERDWLWPGSDSLVLASILAVAAGLLAGGLCGLANGLVITRLRVVPFVATLGMMSMAQGLAFWLSGRTRVSFPGARPAWVDALSRTGSEVLFFDPGVWLVFALALTLTVLARRTVFGRHAYAIGSNEATARLCGVRVERQKVWIYALAGVIMGIAGLLLFAHVNGGDPNAGGGLELEVIAAVVIGGASLGGGQGTVVGTLLGVAILGILENGVSHFQVPIEVKYVLIGAIVVVNTALSGWQRRRSGNK